jgi:hypothetical protein
VEQGPSKAEKKRLPAASLPDSAFVKDLAMEHAQAKHIEHYDSRHEAYPIPQKMPGYIAC